MRMMEERYGGIKKKIKELLSSVTNPLLPPSLLARPRSLPPKKNDRKWWGGGVRGGRWGGEQWGKHFPAENDTF